MALTYRERWLDEAILRILERPSLDVIFKFSKPHNHLPLLASMPTVVAMIRKEYNRIADRACAEPTLRVLSVTGKALEVPDLSVSPIPGVVALGASGMKGMDR